jgi:hypothetical protein
MAGFSKGARNVVFILVAVLILAQAIRIEKSNPPVRSDISADPAIKPLLRRACYNCHSNETVWPWYSNAAPASWLIGSDVKEARRRINFSEWGTYSSEIQTHKLRGIAEEIENGEMPPWYYSLAHSDSRLNLAERTQIMNWTEETLKTLETKP